MNSHESAVDHLLRQVEARAAIREELGATLRGIAGTIAIFATVIGLMVLIVAGAIAFATVMELFAR